MKTITVDFSSSKPVQPFYGGEEGENRAVTLDIIPSTDMSEDEDIAIYYVAFTVEGGIILSETFNQGEDISISLGSVITEQRKVFFQLIATSSDGESVISKSPIVQLFLGKSITGEIIPDPVTGDTIYTEIARLVEAAEHIDLSEYYTKTEVDTIASGKVDEVPGKGLSTEDYTTAEKTKLGTVEAGAEVNKVIDVLDSDGNSVVGADRKARLPQSGGGTITDVQDEQGNSLVSEGIAVIPTGEMLEIVESAEQGVVISKYSRSEIYDFYTEGKALCCQGFPISTVVRGDNYYLYFISGGYNDTPYLSRREVKSDKTITSAQLVGYFTEREYTAAKDTKLSGIATGAEVNVIDTIKDSNGNPLPVTSKAVTLPAIPAAQIQSDWEQSDNTAKDYIKNKPSIPAAQVQADWNESDNTKADYIKNKPTIPDISGKEDTANKVTSLSSSSTDTEYPSAKAVYDVVGDVESALAALIGGNS